MKAHLWENLKSAGKLDLQAATQGTKRDPMVRQFRDLNQCWKWAETPSWSAQWLDLLQHYTTRKLVSDLSKSLSSSLKAEVLHTVQLMCINTGSALLCATCRQQWMHRIISAQILGPGFTGAVPTYAQEVILWNPGQLIQVGVPSYTQSYIYTLMKQGQSHWALQSIPVSVILLGLTPD